jgi:hypothetical protein
VVYSSVGEGGSVEELENDDLQLRKLAVVEFDVVRS